MFYLWMHFRPNRQRPLAAKLYVGCGEVLEVQNGLALLKNFSFSFHQPFFSDACNTD